MRSILREVLVGRSIVGFKDVDYGVNLILDNSKTYCLRIKEEYRTMKNLWAEEPNRDAFIEAYGKKINFATFDAANNEDGALVWVLELELEGMEDMYENTIYFTLDYYGRALVGVSQYFELVEVK